MDNKEFENWKATDINVDSLWIIDKREQKITYRSEIIEVLKGLKGMASLKEIYNGTEARNLLPSIHQNKEWHDNVCLEIQSHCSQTKTYKGGEDIFYSVYGLGEGFWGLRNFDKSAALETVGINPIEERQIEEIKSANISKTEKESLVVSRIGQGFFRKNLIKKYKYCLITGIRDERLLLASHIKPWRSSTNEERLSADNGLLLSPLYDRLFDEGLITFDKNLHIEVSSDISKADEEIIFQNKNICLNINPSENFLKNMKYHNDFIFRKNS